MEFNPDKQSFPLANPRHRLAGFFLNLLFQGITFGIGWFIWSLVVWGQGQTPAHQTLKMRVYSIDTGKPASWGHMLIRQLLIPISFFATYLIAIGITGVVGSNLASQAEHRTTSELILLAVTWLGTVAILILDAFWIFRGNARQRLTDSWARTQVFNESNG